MSLKYLTDEQLKLYYEKYKAMVQKQKRLEGVKRFGYDVKFAYHVIRLASEAQEILETGDLNLEEKGRRELMKAIRNGEWTQEEIKQWFNDKERHLENLYASSKLQWGPDEKLIKNLLLECLEHHFGKLDNVISKVSQEKQLIQDIEAVLQKYR